MSSFLTVEEAAEALKVHPQTIRRWIADGRLPAFRVGNVLRIRQEDWDACIDSYGQTARRPLSGVGGVSSAHGRGSGT